VGKLRGIDRKGAVLAKGYGCFLTNPKSRRQFLIKRSNEAFETPTPNSFVLPDGRTIDIRSVLVRPQNFTCWGLSTLKVLPPNYIRI
jgi:hypothetical protein